MDKHETEEQAVTGSPDPTELAEMRQRLAEANRRITELEALETERKQTEKSLQALTSRYEATLAAVPDIIIEVNNDKVYTWANQAGYVFFGDDVLGKEAAHYFEGDQDTYETVQPLFNGAEEVIYVESWQRRKDGEKRLLAWWCRTLKDANGKVVGALSTARDITDRKQAERALWDSQQMLLTVVENMPVMFDAFDENGVALFWNKECERVTGYSADEIVGNPNSMALFYPDPEKQAQLLEQAHEMQGMYRDWEIETLCKNGETRTIAWSNTSKHHPIPGWWTWGIGVDVTKRKRAEEAFRESEERYRELFDNINSGVAVYEVVDGGKDFIFQDFNKAGERIDGEKKENLIGRSIFEARPGAEDFGLIEIFQRVWETGKPECYPLTFYQDERLTGWYENFVYRLSSGEIVVVFDNVTERKQTEEELRKHREQLEELIVERTAELGERVREVEKLNRAMTNLLQDLQAANRNLQKTSEKLHDANQELADFAYVVSHDLKAPLRGIIQLASWLADDYAEALNENGQELIDLLIGRTRRMHNLIEGILQYSRIGRVTEREKKIDLNRLVQEATELLAPPGHIQLTIEDTLPTVVGEETRLAQIFQNLLSNAIKFMDKPEGKISVGCADKGDHWLFNVTDNGPGIEEKYRDKIFQMFQTLSPRDEFESTGIGLALVKKIVETWGGKIGVESTLGQGSTFFFTLKKG